MSRNVSNIKVLGINDRLTRQIEILLDQMETNELNITFPQRLNALIAIGRIQVMFATLKRSAQYYEQSDAGTKVREYSSAFTTTASGARRRKNLARSHAPDILELGDFGSDDGGDDDNDNDNPEA